MSRGLAFFVMLAVVTAQIKQKAGRRQKADVFRDGQAHLNLKHQNNVRKETQIMRNKLTRSLCILLTMVFLFGMISPAFAVLTDDWAEFYSDPTGQENGNMVLASEPPAWADEEVLLNSELNMWADSEMRHNSDLVIQAGAIPALYEWICDTLPMFGYDPEIDSEINVNFRGMRALAANQVVVIFQGNNHTGGQVPANIVINTPGSFTFPQRGNLVRTGYTFMGWRHAAPNGVLHRPGAIYTLSAGRTGTFTLNAEWNRQPTVTPTLTINPSTNWTNVSNAGSIREVTVTTNQVGWNVSSDRDWLGLSRPSGTSGQRVRLYVQQNPTTSSRTATVEFTAFGAPVQRMTVTQQAGAAANPTLTLNPSTAWSNVSNAGAARDITVTTNQANWSVSSSQNWLVLNRTLGTSGQNVRLTVQPNPTTAARTAIVTFAAGAQTRQVQVTQLPGTGNATLTLNPTSWNPSSGAAVAYISLTTNATSWFIWGNPEWVFARANGPNSVRLEVSANTGASRSGVVTISSGGVFRDITVTQAGAAVNNVMLTFNANGGTPDTTTLSRQPGLTISTLPVTPTRAGFTFAGWFNTSAATGGTQITANTVVPNANTTYWARWTANQNVTVTFNANGGSVSPASRNIQAGTTVGTLPTPTRTGFTFVGWFTAQTGGTQVTANTVVNGNVTYWARWTANIESVNSATISGTPRVGSVLTANVSFTGTVQSPVLTFQWQRYAGSGVWRDISGVRGRGQSFTPTEADANEFIRVVVGGTGVNVTTAQSISPWVRIQRQVTGIQVIECFGRNGYVDVFGSETATTVQCVGSRSVRRPIWEFVHITGDIYAIRNETTGRYLTETNGNLRHEARISGSGINYNNRQRWHLIGENGGWFRIRSVSSPSMYITEGAHILGNNPNLSLSALNTGNNRQRWWIGHIWHTDGRAACEITGEEWAGFWRGPINIQSRTIGEQQPGFNFRARMDFARNVWAVPLDITFIDVYNGDEIAPNAHIRAYGGTRFEIWRETGWDVVNPTLLGIADFGSRVFVGTIHAGGADRRIYRFVGTGSRSNIMAVFSGNNERATMAAIHELGHALGYWAHSPTPDNTMYRGTTSSNNHNELRPAEIEHLRQIYRMFR